MTEVKSINTEEKIWAAVSYLWVLSLVVLAARKKNDFIRFHANQGALMFILSLIFFFIPVLGWLANLLLAIAGIIGIIRALQGEQWEVPVIGGFAKNFGDWIVKTLKL
jgi:uncharacterized membrane protein